jgi:CspA family cold shock protein
MPRGKVRSYDYIHGTGFIDPDDGSEKAKVSYRDIRCVGYKILHEGQKVVFDLHRTSRGPRARNVVPITRRPVR